MAYAEASVIINRDIKEVFEFVLNGENNMIWRPRVRKTECSSCREIDVGTVFYQEIEGAPGRTVYADYKIIACDRYEKITFSVLSGPFLPIGTFLFYKTKNMTNVVFSMNETEIDSQERDRHLQKVVDDLHNLKQYFEAGNAKNGIHKKCFM